MTGQILVLSNQHHLLPFAHRLRLEGADVEVMVWKGGKSHRFERAWEGSFEQKLKPSQKQDNPEFLAPVQQAARDGAVTVITDSYNAAKQFSDAANLFPAVHPESYPESVVRLGGWFDGESFHMPHGLVFDIGAWPGGLGHAKPGGVTLVRIDTTAALDFFFAVTDPIVDELKSMSFRGLVQFGLFLDSADAVPRMHGMQCGWPYLHTHAFVSEIEGFSGLLCEGVIPELPSKYVVAMPVTIPPWPNAGSEAARKVDVGGLTPQWQGRVFWHDIKVDSEQHRLQTAGLDGYVGVVRGAGGTMSLARMNALQVAQKIEMPQKQFRPDVGARVDEVLGGIEAAFGLTL